MGRHQPRRLARGHSDFLGLIISGIENPFFPGLIKAFESQSLAGGYVFDGRSYERVGSTTSVMSQETYQRLLLERAHAKQRWENLPAAVVLAGLDQDEILSTLTLGAAAGRMPASVSADAADVLDRLGLRVCAHVLNAAVVVYGRRILPDYPQCQLRSEPSGTISCT